jgi:hypothetical protein
VSYTNDDVVAESFFSNLKDELLHHCLFTTREEAGLAHTLIAADKDALPKKIKSIIE